VDSVTTRLTSISAFQLADAAPRGHLADPAMSFPLRETDSAVVCTVSDRLR